MKEKTITKYFLIYSIITVIEIFRIHNIDNCSTSLSMIFWWIDIHNMNSFFSSFSLIMLPQILLMIFWGDYFEEMIYSKASLLFPRHISPFSLIRKNYLKLILSINLCLGSLFCLLYIFCIITEKHPAEPEFLTNVLLYMTYMIHLMIFINFISIINSSILGTLLGIAIQTASLIVICIFYEKNISIIRWLPAYTFILCQKNNLLFQKSLEIIYLIGLSTICYICNGFIIKRKEWI